MANATAVESTKRTFLYNVANTDRVIDGDTMEVTLDLGFNIFYKVEVRLNGLDTPEKNTAEGKLVKAKVEEWVKGKILIVNSRELDKFGRVLGEITTDKGDSLNKWLLAEGYARVYNGEKKVAWTEAQIKNILSKGNPIVENTKK